VEGGLQMRDVASELQRHRLGPRKVTTHFPDALRTTKWRSPLHSQSLGIKFVSSSASKQYSASSLLHICDCASIGS
jgi:hypothetical protein